MISECRLGPCCAACKILQIFMRHNKNNTRWFVQYSDSLNSAYKYLPSALLNGQITNGKWSTVKVPPGSVFLCQGPVPALLGWAYPEQLGLSSTACGLVLGDFHSSMHKWGLAPSPNCECGASEQTADHVLTAFPTHRAPHGARGLTVLDDETQCWLNNTTASI